MYALRVPIEGQDGWDVRATMSASAEDVTFVEWVGDHWETFTFATREVAANANVLLARWPGSEWVALPEHHHWQAP